MRTAIRTLALALTVSTGALWAQSQTTTPQSNSDEPATAASAAEQPTDPATPNPPATANPMNQESDALPQSGATQSTESTTPPPVTEEPLNTTATPPPPAENPKPAEPAREQQTVYGAVVSSSSSALVIETASGSQLTFVVDSATTVPELHAKDAVSVQYVSLPDGTRHADRVTVATPKKSAVAAAPRHTTPPAPKTPAVAPAAPAASVAVAPPTPAAEPAPLPPVVNEPAPAADASASSSETTASHTLDSGSAAVNPLATTKAASDFSPTRMVVPVVILLGGLLFITVLGVRQARREA